MRIYFLAASPPARIENPMGRRFQEIAFTPLVKEHQKEHGSRRQYERMAQSAPAGDLLGPSEQDFIQRRDSFYMASVSETGWPYIQHRGGPKGFVHILNPSLIGFADYRGNKQYISLGNFDHDNRVAIFFMDYPYQTRLKILGRVEVHEHDSQSPELIKSFRSGEDGVIERVILIHVEGFDWNCPQHITPRYTAEELEQTLAPVRERLANLETENATLKTQLVSLKKGSPQIKA
jgi:predicted pyridoxine 5'-phosphate oxidase superfamily flavin-nucleotide-binding protein